MTSGALPKAMAICSGSLRASHFLRRNNLDAQRILVLNLDAIGAHVHLVEVVRIIRIGRNQRKLGEVATGILVVDAIEWQQVEQVDVVARGSVERILLAGSLLARKDLGLHGIGIPTTIELKELLLGGSVLVHAHHESVVCPGTMNVGNDARTLGIARDVVEHHGRTVLHTGGSAASRRHAGLGQYFVGDVQKLALLLKCVEERTQILINLGHVYSPIQRGLRYPYVIAARVT